MFLQTNPPEIDFTTRVQPWNLRFFPSERVNRLYVWHKIIKCTSQSAGDAHSDAAAPAKLVFLSYHDLWGAAIDSADKIYLDWFAFITSNHDTSIDGAHTTRKSRRHDSHRVSKVDFSLAQPLPRSQNSKNLQASSFYNFCCANDCVYLPFGRKNRWRPSALDVSGRMPRNAKQVRRRMQSR